MEPDIKKIRIIGGDFDKGIVEVNFNKNAEMRLTGKFYSRIYTPYTDFKSIEIMRSENGKSSLFAKVITIEDGKFWAEMERKTYERILDIIENRDNYP